VLHKNYYFYQLEKLGITLSEGWHPVFFAFSLRWITSATRSNPPYIHCFFTHILSIITNINATKKHINEAMKSNLVKNETAIAMPPNAQIPSIMATTKNKIAQSNNIETSL
jgi:hypothetical protein